MLASCCVWNYATVESKRTVTMNNLGIRFFRCPAFQLRLCSCQLYLQHGGVLLISTDVTAPHMLRNEARTALALTVVVQPRWRCSVVDECGDCSCGLSSPWSSCQLLHTPTCFRSTRPNASADPTPTGQSRTSIVRPNVNGQPLTTHLRRWSNHYTPSDAGRRPTAVDCQTIFFFDWQPTSSLVAGGRRKPPRWLWSVDVGPRPASSRSFYRRRNTTSDRAPLLCRNRLRNTPDHGRGSIRPAGKWPGSRTMRKICREKILMRLHRPINCSHFRNL